MADQEPALVPGITLSDLVIREAGSNKPSLIGCFQAFNFPQFPARSGRFFATISITNLGGKIEELNATCRLEVAGTGHVVSSTSVKVQFAPENPQLNPRVSIDISIPFMNVFPVFLFHAMKDLPRAPFKNVPACNVNPVVSIQSN
jgi:hypothetical protein